MPNKIILKKSSVTTKVPLVTDLDYGELALNYADGKLFFKTATNTIESFGPAANIVYTTGDQSITGVKTFTNGLAISTNTTPAVLTKNDGVSSWLYSGKSKSVASEETSPTGIFFKPDGTEMYVVGQGDNDVNQYTLSTAWDVTTATFTRVSVAVTSTLFGCSGIFFKPDGLIMYVTYNDKFEDYTVREFALSTAWDVSTITFVRELLIVDVITLQDLWFKPDGTKMYVVSGSNDTIYEYNLSTAWNIGSSCVIPSSLAIQ
jgi:DNA-binding beta-propeller fold protein YncE